jgi:ubiquinone/menaquinone biosynthesis C-methylase UbiE
MPSDRGPAFDELASTYDAWYETPVGRLVDGLERAAILALVAGRSADLALDLACGTGRYAIEHARRGLRSVGVDRSAPMLRVARARAGQAGVSPAFVCADGAALPFREGAFDLVTLILGLEFVPDPAAVLGEVRRVLRPGGQLVLAILNRRGAWTLWRRLKRHLVRSVWRRAAFLEPEEVERLLERCGFSGPRWRQAVYFVPLFGRRVARVMEWWERAAPRWTRGRATFMAVAARRA